MIAFVISRLLQSVPVLLAVGFIAFAMCSFLGDPVTIMLGQDYTEAQRIALTRELGLDQPFVVQYAKFLLAAISGNLGVSYRLARPVATLLAERAPATLELAFASASLACGLGIPMGVYAAIRPRSWLSHLMSGVSLVGVSLPTFLVGILLILVFSVVLGVLPSFGRGQVVHIGWWSTGLLTISGLKALVLPAVTLALFQLALIMRLVRAEMMEVLRSDFIRFARARGLPDRAVYVGHALRNTLVPVITIIGLQLGLVIAFSIVTESVFQWPGLGLLFVQSVQSADLPVIAAYLMMTTVVYTAINLAVDLSYYAIDPRLRRGLRANEP